MHALMGKATTVLKYPVAKVAGTVFRSFRTKVMSLVILSVVVPWVTIWWVTVRNTEGFQKNQTQEKFLAVLNGAKRDISFWSREREHELKRLIQSNGFLRPLERYLSGQEPAAAKKEISRYFEIVSEKFLFYEAFVVLNNRGRPIIASTEAGSENLALLKSLFGQSAQRSAPILQSTDDGYFQWILVTGETDNGGTATVGVKTRLNELTPLLGSRTTADVVDLYVLDNEGRFLTEPRTGDYNPLTGEKKNMLGQRSSDIDIAAQQIGSPNLQRYTKVIISDNGNQLTKKYLASTVYHSDLEWWIVCEAEESNVIAPVVTWKKRILFVTIFVCASFVAGVWMLSRHLLEPLTQLSLGAKRINQGLVGVKIPVSRNDEIGEMITAFNEMAQRIAVNEAKLKKKHAELRRTNDELQVVNDKLEELSVTDGLTGLFNHRHFWNLMTGELRRVNTYPGQLALVLVDIDNFKQVNDHFGHSTGDLLIQRISNIMKATVRESDLVARYGGEEFAVLLPDTNREGALNVSEKVRRAVERGVFRVPETDITISITVSVGVSLFRRSQKEFFNAADRALYMSKAEGKNQVNFAMATN
jgi:diguanylate cyclase (GGDEF)-like protein